MCSGGLLGRLARDLRRAEQRAVAAPHFHLPARPARALVHVIER